MADAALFVGWGIPVRGREHKALQVFNEAVQQYTRWQQQGDIESFEPVLLEPHGGDLAGFLIIRGERAKLERLRYSEDFQRVTTRAGHVVDHIGVVGAFVGEGIERQLADWGAQAQDLA